MPTFLSASAVTRLIHALGSQPVGGEVANAINAGIADSQSGETWCCAAVIVATNTSQTVDFASLAVGDQVAVIPAAAGNSHFVTVATAGTLGEAAVVGSLYVALRKITFAAAVSTAL
jgi:hypothetical protein